MIINLTGNNSYFANTYLYVSGGEAVLIDASASPSDVFAALDNANAKLKAIVLTHGHYDHVIYYKELKNAFSDVTVYSGENENLILSSETANVSSLFGNPTVYPNADNVLKDGDLLTVGGATFKIMITPGHTPGSLCLVNEAENIMFSGDTLFAGGIGRTDFEFGSYTEIQKSLSRLAKLPESMKFYPGHGESSTIGWEF